MVYNASSLYGCLNGLGRHECSMETQQRLQEADQYASRSPPCGRSDNDVRMPPRLRRQGVAGPSAKDLALVRVHQHISKALEAPVCKGLFEFFQWLPCPTKRLPHLLCEH